MSNTLNDLLLEMFERKHGERRTVSKRISELRELIKKHDILYYAKNEPIITDHTV